MANYGRLSDWKISSDLGLKRYGEVFDLVGLFHPTRDR